MQVHFKLLLIQSLREVSLIDNIDDAYALGFLAVGVKDWTKATDEDFKKASDFLRKVHKNVRQYHADGGEGSALMMTGEILLEWTWNEVAFTMGFEENAPKVVFNRDTKKVHQHGYVDIL